MPGRLRGKLRDPVAWTELLQLVKTVVAAVAAWVVATQVFALPQAFLAPWSALLVVHATVYRTLAQGVQQIGATVVGVALAWAAGEFLGLDPLSVALLLLVSLVLGKVTPLRLDGTTVAATAVVVLTVGYVEQDHVLLLRFVDTAVGIGVGMIVNLIVWPPLGDFTAARAIDAVNLRVGTLLRQVALGLAHNECGDDDVREWIDRTRELDEDLGEAWALLRQARESGRLNPRRGASEVKRSHDYADLLDRMEHGVAEIRSMARTLGHSIEDVREWDAGFKERWVDLVDQLGAAIEQPDSQRIVGVRQDLQTLAHELSRDDLSTLHWVEYGGLILNLRNIATSMDRVAASTPAIASSVSGHRPMLRAAPADPSRGPSRHPR
jgi:hypothetical protein